VKRRDAEGDAVCRATNIGTGGTHRLRKTRDDGQRPGEAVRGPPNQAPPRPDGDHSREPTND
jgi:hypothetical protein